jgi:hypothetical protein
MLQYLQYLSRAALNDALYEWQLQHIPVATSMNTCGGLLLLGVDSGNDSWAKGFDG